MVVMMEFRYEPGGKAMPKKIDIGATPISKGSRYPAPYDEPCQQRLRRRLGDAAGLSQFGVNLTRLPPGCWSSQRHWHTAEDEFVYILEGEAVLITDTGEETLYPGDCAGFGAGKADGHHLVNRSALDVVLLEVGTRNIATDEVFYPDIDLMTIKGRAGYAHKDGAPYDE
jgi:uncharacterized cupin superfamily protein